MWFSRKIYTKQWRTHVVTHDILKNHFHEYSKDFTANRSPQRSCYNERSDTHGFCPKALSSLRPVKIIEYDEQGHDEGGSSCQRKQHMMDVTRGD